jgi:hypothetical protein
MSAKRVLFELKINLRALHSVYVYNVPQKRVLSSSTFGITAVNTRKTRALRNKKKCTCSSQCLCINIREALSLDPPLLE